MGKSVSKTYGSSVQTNKQKNIQKNTQNNVQKGTSTTTKKDVTNQRSNSKTISDATNWSTTNQTGGNRNVSYKDLSGLSPETIALQQKVYNSTGYTPSQAVNNAYGKKEAAEQAVAGYGKYNSNYQAALNKTLNDILNRKSFDYNFNEDVLYQNYRDSYERQGKQAAQNAAAAAAALTGGYGNSYATSAASQANEEYMTALNDKIPELYQLALQRYNNETQDLYNRYNALGTQEDREYNRYNTERQNLMADREYAGTDYRSEQNADMTAQQNAYNNALNLLNYRTGLEVKDVSDGTNWSTANQTGGSHEESNSKTNSKSESKGSSKSREKSTQKKTDKSTNITESTTRDNSSSVTTTTGTGSGGKGSKGSKGSNSTKVNNLSGTTTSRKNVDEALKTFKEKSNYGRDKDTGQYNQKNTSEAYDYLMEKVEDGFISVADMQWIYDATGVPMPTKRR